MQEDLRATALYQEVEALYQALRQPGTGQISDAAEVDVSPDGGHVLFTGTLVDALEGAPSTRIGRIDLRSGDTRLLTFGPNSDRLPKYSPDGRHVALLSDRHRVGDFQLYLLDPDSGAVRPTVSAQGWVEYLEWSPDGTRILLGIAGYGADVAGRHGAISTKRVAQKAPSWAPTVDVGDESYRWRSVWVYDLATGRMCQVSHTQTNIWEATWCGAAAIAVVASPGPAEGLWYRASLHIVELESGKSRQVYVPKDQLGCPAASVSGKYLAIVEALASDRCSVAGELRLIETASAKIHRFDTLGMDITYIEWQSEHQLLLAGHRGFETVVGVGDAASGIFTEVWSSPNIATGEYIRVSGLNTMGDCVVVGESFLRAPEIALIRRGEYQVVKSFDVGYAGQAKVIDSVESVSWKAADGLEIQGWLLRPRSQGPHPLVMNVHGGPVSHWRPTWLGRRAAVILMLLKRGYAVFFPNPRGSSGRGQEFARHVLGEMGGADTYDYLSGLDHLVERGIADSRRLGVTGTSYGGFMTAWLITQDSRFAAAVAVAPITNQVTQHLLSNIPNFVALFLDDHYDKCGGKYFTRSPIMHAHRVRTPTLNICGQLDRCTPPQEARQFHNALLEHGVRSTLVTYPEEGHGIRKFPAAIDYAARVVAWFDEHMPGDQRV